MFDKIIDMLKQKFARKTEYGVMPSKEQESSIAADTIGGNTTNGEDGIGDAIDQVADVHICKIENDDTSSDNGYDVDERGDNFDQPNEYDEHGRDDVIDRKTAETIGGKVVIPSGMKKIHFNFFEGNQNLTSVIIPGTVKTVAARAFAECANLEEVTFPKHPVKIDALAFADCRKLNSISIPEGNKTIEPNTFIHCASLKEIEFPDCLTAIENSAFEGCRALEKINLPKDVKKIHVYAFRGCTKLKEIHFSHRLEEIGEYAFDNCQKLEEVVFPDTLKIIEVGAFCNCEGLTLISFPGDIKEVSSDLGVSITEAEDDDFGFDEGFSFSIYRDTRNTLKLKNLRIVVRGSLGEPLKKVLQKNKVMDKVCLPDIECSMAPVAAREATALYILQKQREGSEIPSNILSSYLKYMKAHNIPM